MNVTKTTSSRAFFGAALGALLLVGAGCGPKTAIDANVNASVNVNAGAERNTPPGNEARQLLLTLNAQNGSGISGKALLVEQNDKTKVMLNVNGTVSGAAHPAHIHMGACPTPGGIKWNLSDVMEGKSVTVIDASFDDVVTGLPLAINLHKSATELSAYVSCGDLLASSVEPKDPGAESMMSVAATVKAAAAVKKEWKVTLSAQTAAAIAGTAILTEVDGKTKVKVAVTGAAAGSSMPAHIHMGACPKPGDIKWNLNDVVSGKSETTIDASIDQIKASLPLAINVHKSATELQTFMSCGDLKADLLTEIKVDAGINAGATLK